MNNLAVKIGAVWLGLILILISSSNLVNAQITIKEEVQIQSRNTAEAIGLERQKLAEAGAYYYPIIRDIGFGKYLVLKSGELKFYFDQAETYGINGIEEHRISYTVKSVTGVRSGSLSLYEIMGTPISIRELANKGGDAPSCTESNNFFENALNYGVGAFEDTWIERGNAEANYGGENSLLSFGLFDELKPDSAGASMFLKFGLGELSTNATLASASLILQTSSNNADQIGSFNIYRAGGVWNEMTLTYSNRPIPEVSDFITATEADTAENEIKYIYDVDITPFVNEWLAGQADDYGIEIASFTGHTFASSESFFRASPTIDLSFINNESLGFKIANLGFVEAGDTLEIDFQDFNKGLFANFNANNAGIEAEDQVIFFGTNNCLDNRIRALPFIEDATEDRYFEFVSNLETAIPVDTTGGVFSEFLEPKLLYDNESVQGLSIFDQSFMEIYDSPFVENSNGNSVPLATFFDPEEFEFTPFAPLSEISPGALLRVENASENEGLSFKIRVAGWMIKGLSAGKLATVPLENELLAMLMDTGNNVVLSNVDDPNCSFPTDVIAENIFTNCFEFTVGGKDRLFVEAEPGSIYPGEASVLTAKLITVQGDTVDFPSNQNFEVSIDEGFRDLGSLLSATNDTADVITNIGPVFGFLSDAPVEEPQSVSITLITSYEGEVLRGSKELGLKAPFDLAIILDDEREVQPTLRVGNGTNNLEEFSVTVLENGIGIPSHEVELTLRFIPSTGGHDHVAAPAESLLGSLENTVTNDSGIGRLTTRTNQEGVINIEYTATEIGGQIEIKARSISQFNEVVDSLSVKVPNLILFQGTGSYTLTGETTNHLNNHYIINQQAINSLLGASTAFENAEWNTTGEMRINDMSLEWGGLFDISGQWRTPHNSHRTGRDVDIENISARDTTLMVLNPDTGLLRERTVLVFESEWIRNYERIMQRRNWFFVNEEQNNPNRDPDNDQPGIRFPHFNWRGN